MNPPFTIDEFLGLFAAYNQAATSQATTRRDPPVAIWTFVALTFGWASVFWDQVVPSLRCEDDLMRHG